MPYAIKRNKGKLQVDGPESEIIEFYLSSIVFVLVNAIKELELDINDIKKLVKILVNMQGLEGTQGIQKI